MFCEIIGKTASAEIVDEWEESIAIVPLNPVTDGHILVIPRTHVRDAVSFPDLTALVMKRVALVAGDRAPCNIITSVGEIATQTVFHLHVHIVPRRPNDFLALPWTSQIALQQIMAARITELEGQVEVATLNSIEARNPGIDMDDVREYRRTGKFPVRKARSDLADSEWLVQPWR